MTLSFDLYWSFRSPFSYLATPRLYELTRTHDIVCHARPVYPTAVRAPEFFTKVDPLWAPYFMRDMQRSAEMLALPLVWPRPDPVATDPETRRPLPDQSRIIRLTRLGAAAEEAGRGLAFLYHVSRRLWDPAVQDWDQNDTLAEAAAAAGLDLKDLDAKIASDGERYEGIIQESQTEQAKFHWGVPLMVFDGEPFFGQDRVEMLIWRLRQKGLEPKTSGGTP